MLSAIIFIGACFMYALYSHYQIKVGTVSLAWHITQWLSATLFTISGFSFAWWWRWNFTYGMFGNIIAIAVLGIPTYVFFLHWLNRRHDAKVFTKK